VCASKVSFPTFTGDIFSWPFDCFPDLSLCHFLDLAQLYKILGNLFLKLNVPLLNWNISNLKDALRICLNSYWSWFFFLDVNWLESYFILRSQISKSTNASSMIFESIFFFSLPLVFFVSIVLKKIAFFQHFDSTHTLILQLNYIGLAPFF